MSKSRIFTDRISKRSVQRLVRKWIKALRSGDFHQGRDQLRSKGYEVEDGLRLKTVNKYAYCCLGVACAIIDPKAWRREGHKLGATVMDGSAVAIKERDSVLGPDALELLGLKKSANNILSSKNDHGDDFEEIATFIEKEMAKATA